MEEWPIKVLSQHLPGGTEEDCSQDSPSPVQDLNPGVPEYEADTRMMFSYVVAWSYSLSDYSAHHWVVITLFNDAVSTVYVL